ncbi:MAG: hypothetical protein JKY29_01390 [Gammaproteobacteria bacterium]|nr:hypothetical protein [Gammaproteobacteria bacterium]
MSSKIWLRVLGVGSLVCLLFSCEQEAVEWIDIPLADNVFFEDSPEFNTDVIEIPLFALSDLEYKLDMKQGAGVSYQWEANGLPEPELLLTEFHGHTIRTSDAPGDLMFYKIGRNSSSEGYMVAPFDGIHGWYFSNESNVDISIVLTVSGFYTIPDE